MNCKIIYYEFKFCKKKKIDFIINSLNTFTRQDHYLCEAQRLPLSYSLPNFVEQIKIFISFN